MTLHNLEKEMVNPTIPLRPSYLSRINANIGVLLRIYHVRNDPLIYRLGELANGVWNAATAEAQRIPKPINWGGNLVIPPKRADLYSYHAYADTKFGYFSVNHWEGAWKLRVDGNLHQAYDSPEEAMDAAFEVYKERLSELFI